LADQTNFLGYQFRRQIQLAEIPDIFRRHRLGQPVLSDKLPLFVILEINILTHELSVKI